MYCLIWLIEREFAITSSISEACSTEQALASTRSIEHGSAHSESTRLRIELKLFTCIKFTAQLLLRLTNVKQLYLNKK